MSQQKQTMNYVANNFINPPIMISKSKKIIDVIEKLTELGISRLVVHDSGKPIGIITSRDLVPVLLNNQNTLNVHHIELTDIMKDIVYVDQMMSIKNCAETFLSKGINYLAVKHDDFIKGIFTKSDLVRFFSSNYNNDIKVSDYMKKDVVSIYHDEPVHKIIKKMLDEKIPRIIVTTDKDSLKIITMGDFFRAAFGMNGPNNIEEWVSKLEKIRENIDSTLLIGSNTLAKDIMSKKDILTVNSSDSLNWACKTMLSNYVDAVGVMDENHTLCGILTHTDVIRAILNQEKTRHTVQQMESKKSIKIKKSLDVLVVDDSDFSLNIYKDMFQKRGHNIDTAINGSKCLDAYNLKMIETFADDKTPYDVVILDYEMPGLKGNEVAQRLVSINPNQRITIISSLEIEEMQKEFSSIADYVEIIEKGTSYDAIISELEMR